MGLTEEIASYFAHACIGWDKLNNQKLLIMLKEQRLVDADQDEFQMQKTLKELLEKVLKVTHYF